MTLEVGTETYAATATAVPEVERVRLYATIAERMPGFADYAAKTDRVIPIVRLVRT